jgi:hypothetical protein
MLLYQADSVSRNLLVPVLVHRTKKPACFGLVAQYFSPTAQDWPNAPVIFTSSASSSSSTFPSVSSAVPAQRRQLPSPPPPSPSPPPLTAPPLPRLLVVGDRLATDVILANRLARLTGWQVDAVWTLRIWKYEGLANSLMRWLELGAYRGVAAVRRRMDIHDETNAPDWQGCLQQAEEEERTGRRRASLVSDRLSQWYAGGLGLGVRWPDAIQRLRKACRFPSSDNLRIP